MKHKHLLSIFILFLGMGLLQTESLHAQGVTSASLIGVILDSNGEELPGATVLAVHVPSGTKYGTAARVDGRYTIPGMRVGGPYSVTISFVGYETKVIDSVFLSLGQEYNLKITLQEEGVQLTDVVVKGTRNAILNSERTGAETHISNTEINSLPTISRGLADFTRLTPQASVLPGGGISFAGQNNRYNQFSIDGTVNNDVFGLSASGTNGGQTNVQPISLDAIEQVQVVLAPYDVRLGGFTGAGINAITRSGTNTFEGSVFYYGNNEKLVGKSPDEARTKLDEYTDYQTGFRLGGPIVKDKLFFFINGEVTKKTSPLLFAPGSSSSNISGDEVERVASVAERLGYDPGVYNEISDNRSSEKFFARLDWNINQNNKLTLRHSYTYGEEIDNSRNPNSVRFYNNGIFFPSTTNTTVLELNSLFGNNASNDLRIGYTTVRDDRNALGDPFPSVTVRLGGGRQIQLGAEPYSAANQLDQNIFTITDNVTLYKGKHTLTFGTHNEFFKTYNLFIRQNYGAYTYNSLEDFETVGTGTEALPNDYNYSYSRTDNPLQGADFNAFQM